MHTAVETKINAKRVKVVRSAFCFFRKHPAEHKVGRVRCHTTFDQSQRSVVALRFYNCRYVFLLVCMLVYMYM